MFTIYAIQYLQSNGTKKEISAPVPDSVKPYYDDMLAHNCWLEAETLSNGLIAIAITNKDLDLDWAVTSNDETINKIITMLKRQRWVRN